MNRILPGGSTLPWTLSLLTLCWLLIASPTQAAFVLVEDFNALTASGIQGQSGWTANDATVNVVTSPGPFSPSNKGLSNGVSTSGAYKNIGSIANGEMGTLFLQFYATDLAAGTSFGLGDADIDLGTFNSFRSQLALTNTGAFTVRDGASSVNLGQSVQTNTLYNIWMVSDNDANSTEFYIQGGAYVNQTPLTNVAGTVSSFAYRNNEPSSASVTNFFMKTGAGTDDFIYFDNIYFSSGVDLSNPLLTAESSPIPEPSGLALLSLGGVLLLVWRKK